MSKFLKLLEQAEPVDPGSKQEMIQKLAELFNLIDGVEVSPGGENIMVNVGGTTIKLAVVSGEEDNEDPASVITRNVKDIAADPPINGKVSPETKQAQKVLDQKKAADIEAIGSVANVIKRLKTAIAAFKTNQPKKVTQ
jgi:hypothetical protein